MFKSRLLPDRSWESLQWVVFRRDFSVGSTLWSGIQITLEGGIFARNLVAKFVWL